VPAIRLSPSARITETPAGVLLCSDLGTFSVTGPDVRVFLDRIVPLCDGTRDRDAIGAALPYAPRSVQAFLDLLARRGLIEDVGQAPARRRGQEAFLARWAQGAWDPAARLGAARVLVAGPSPWGAAAAVELAAAGVGTVARADGDALPAEAAGDLVVAAVAPDDAAQIERVARFAAALGVSCLWSHVAGGAAFLGPLSVPRRAACRLCAGVGALNPALRGDGADPGPRAPRLVALLGQMVALEALKILTGYAPTSLVGRLLKVDARTFETTLHTLVRLPWCDVCGPALRAP
jgi:hypothetical protein